MKLGRGTATFDGLSIAWAVLEHLHDVNHCRTLFASHYHELEALATRLPGLSCHTMKVKEWQGELVFLHEVINGSAEHSYGVHVARLAGLPDSVIHRARAILRVLESRQNAKETVAFSEDELPLFQTRAPKAGKLAGLGQIVATAPAPIPSPPAKDDLREFLAGIEPDNLTPRAAMEVIYKLKGMI